MRAERVARDGASISARLAVGVAVAAASLLLAACGPGHATGSHGAAQVSASASVTAPQPTPTLSASGASPQPSLAATGTASCAQFAAHTFLHLLSVTNEPDGSLALTANAATVVCGGPDDLHYDIGTNMVTAHTVLNPSVTIFSLASMQSLVIAPSQLVTYLPTDTGTRIFLVSGPLSAIASLQEQYHP